MKTELEYIEDYVAEIYGVDKRALYSKKRKAHLCTVRYTFWYLLKEVCDWTLTRIADKVGKDHTTIINGIKQFKLRGGEQQFNAKEVSRRMQQSKAFKQDRYIGQPVDIPGYSGDRDWDKN